MSQFIASSLLLSVFSLNISHNIWRSQIVQIYTISNVITWLSYCAIAILLIYLISVRQQVKKYQRSEEYLKQINNQLQITIRNQALILENACEEKKKLQTQLLHSQRLQNIGMLTSGIAHDLNNMLTPIIMSVAILKLKSFDQQSEQLLEIVENTARRGVELVGKMLSFTRSRDEERTDVDVRNLVSEVVQLVKRTFPKSIQVKTEIESNLCSINADAIQLHQVLMNLMVNARDAMPRSGTLSLSVKNVQIGNSTAKSYKAKAGSYVVMTVADTGVGIPPETLKHIFQPFYTTKAQGQGTGLGLSTVMDIVKNHDGFVTLESKVGFGTQFDVYLPVAKARALPEDKVLVNLYT